MMFEEFERNEAFKKATEAVSTETTEGGDQNLDALKTETEETR